jgi:hypothetical protein
MTAIADRPQTPTAKRAKISNTKSTAVESPVTLSKIPRTQVLKIRLAAAATRKAGLLNPDIVYVENYKWITNIDDDTHYLFSILSLVLCVDHREIKLSIQPDGKWREETSKTWVQVKEGSEILLVACIWLLFVQVYLSFPLVSVLLCV